MPKCQARALKNVDEAPYKLLYTFQGSNAISMLHVDKENMFLHLVHKGKTTGPIVWANEKNEVAFCSRPEPVIEEFERLLVRDRFKGEISIKWREDAGVKLSFPIVSNKQQIPFSFFHITYDFGQ